MQFLNVSGFSIYFARSVHFLSLASTKEGLFVDRYLGFFLTFQVPYFNELKAESPCCLSIDKLIDGVRFLFV